MLRILLALTLVLGACTPQDSDQGLHKGSYGGTVGAVVLSSPDPCLAEGQDYTVTVAWVRSGPNVLPFDTVNVAIGLRNPATDAFIQPVNNYRTTGTSFSRTLKCPPAGETTYLKACVRVLRPGQPATADRCAFLDKTTTYGPPDPVDSVYIVSMAVVGPEYQIATYDPLMAKRGYPDAANDRVGACERWQSAFPDSSPWVEVNETAVPYCTYAWMEVEGADTTRGESPFIAQYCACFQLNGGDVVTATPVFRFGREYCESKCEEVFS